MKHHSVFNGKPFLLWEPLDCRVRKGRRRRNPILTDASHHMCWDRQRAVKIIDRDHNFATHLAEKSWEINPFLRQFCQGSFNYIQLPSIFESVISSSRHPLFGCWCDIMSPAWHGGFLDVFLSQWALLEGSPIEKDMTTAVDFKRVLLIFYPLEFLGFNKYIQLPNLDLHMFFIHAWLRKNNTPPSYIIYNIYVYAFFSQCQRPWRVPSKEGYLS